MSFQAYLDTIREKTGLGPDQFRALAEERGLLAPGVKATAVIDWLASDYGLGRGHAMALIKSFAPREPQADRTSKLFAGEKARWQPVVDDIIAAMPGPVGTAPTATYLSLLKGTGKFAIVAPTAARLDLGIKLKDAPATDRFEAAGSWNSMVTHRVRLSDPAELDPDVLDWLRRAYDRA